MEKPNLNFKDKVTILVDFFIKPDILETWTPKDWGRERFAAKRLFTKYPDFDFFYSLQDLYERFNSLLGISDKYVKDLTKRYEDFCIEKEKHKEFKLEDRPVVQIEQIRPKAKNLLEYLDN